MVACVFFVYVFRGLGVSRFQHTHNIHNREGLAYTSTLKKRGLLFILFQLKEYIHKINHLQAGI